MKRSLNLSGGHLAKVVKIVQSIPGKPSWSDVVIAIQEGLGMTYTRQALNRHASIRAAYERRNAGDPARPSARRLSARAQSEKDRRERDALRIAELEERIAAYGEIFITWSYNAYLANMTDEMLNAPLVEIHRASDGRRTMRP